MLSQKSNEIGSETDVTNYIYGFDGSSRIIQIRWHLGKTEPIWAPLLPTSKQLKPSSKPIFSEFP